MILTVFSLRDAKIDSFGNPFFSPMIGSALRLISDEVNRQAEDNNLFKHSEDFELFELGTFDTQTGLFEIHVPKSVMLCSNLKRA